MAPTGNLGRAPGILIWYSTNDITGIMFGLGVASTTVSQSFYYDSFMVTEGSTVYNYADGASTNWIRVGTPHDSASMGPAL